MGGGGRKGKRSQPPSLALPGAVSTAPSGLHKGRPRPPRGTVVGGVGRAPGSRSCQTWVGRSEGGPAARARSWAARGGPRGARSRPLFANGPLPDWGENRAIRSGSIRCCPRRRVWSVRLCGRARAGRKWDSSSPRRAAGSSGRTLRRRKEPPAAAPLPFRFH